ncbi:MAG: flagellar basal body-associated protein FliL [Parashewanella sp.]
MNVAEEETLSLEEQPKPKSKMIIVIIAVVAVLLVGGIGAFFLMGDSESPTEPTMSEPEQVATVSKDKQARYVGIGGSFLFNLQAPKRSILVQIKVELMVRGADDETDVKKHIPLIKSELLSTFSAAEANKLKTQSGKDELRQQALINVQNALRPIMGRNVVEKVLFTGFVMQ